MREGICFKGPEIATPRYLDSVALCGHALGQSSKHRNLFAYSPVSRNGTPVPLPGLVSPKL